MILEIKTKITVDDDIDGELIEQIRHEFEDVAWENNYAGYKPKVTISELE